MAYFTGKLMTGSTASHVHVLLGVLLAASALFFTSEAWAGNPLAGCTEETFGASCNRDGKNACSGVCLLDSSQAGAPIACVPADAAALESLGLASFEGAPCAPSGVPGSDCRHACTSGTCSASNAASLSSCIPEGGGNICAGTCDGTGNCVASSEDTRTR